MSSSKKLLIRADVGPTVGTGHVMRMLALGQAWQAAGGTVTFVVGNAVPKRLLNRLDAEGFTTYVTNNSLGDSADARNTVEIASLVQPDWIVLDGYQFNDHFQSMLTDADCRILAMDDYGHANHTHADLVVNQNKSANLTDSSTKWIGGTQFTILRNEFVGVSDEAKRIPKQARRILVTFGGADSDNWTIKALNVLNQFKTQRLVVDCVVGACYPHLDELSRFKKSANINLRVHSNVDRMSDLMRRADVAVSAGGSTCYELASCGVPTVATAIAANQQSVLDCLIEQDAIEALDPAYLPDAEFEPLLKESLRKLIPDWKRRQQLSNAGRTVVDGLGANRIIQQMLEFRYPIRKATFEDAEQLWHWRNDPEVRSVSFDDQFIPLENHKNWLGRRLEDSETVIWIAENRAGAKVASLRFDLNTSNDLATISIVVDQAFRGRGVGRILIGSAINRLFCETNMQSVLAMIKPGNIASEKAFQASGFEKIEPAIVGGKMAIQYLKTRSSSTTKPPVKDMKQTA